MKKIMVINGVNLNMLGIREKNLYGQDSYNSLIELIKNSFKDNKNVEINFFQSNHEGDIVDCIQNCYFDKFDGIVINPGAFTHYSYAILDALKSVSIPTVEVHITDIQQREEFRHISVIKDACINQIKGRGFQGYIDAIEELISV